MRFGGHLKRLRREKGLTLEDVSRATGISRPHISLLERGLRRPTSETARLLAGFFGIEEKKLWLEHCLENLSPEVRQALEEEAVRAASGRCLVETEAEGLRRIPVFNVVAGGWIDFGDGDHPVGFADEYVYLPIGDPNCFACKIAGDSMFQDAVPSFSAGDIVVFSPGAEVSAGDFVFARSDEIGATFKQVFFDETGQTVRLCSLNRKYPEKYCPRDEVRLYKMVFQIKNYRN